MRRHVFLLVFALATLVVGCAGRTTRGTVQGNVVASVPTRVSLSEHEARVRFVDALAMMKAGEARQAAASFDAIVEAYPDSRYVSASLYNAGLCLQRLAAWDHAAVRYERLLQRRPDSPDVRHAKFQLAFLHVETERFDEALAYSIELLNDAALTRAERIELLARRAQAELGLGQLPPAADSARQALALYRARDEVTRTDDPFFAAAASFTLAETVRMRSEQVDIPEAEVERQHAALERRAALLLQAQSIYFTTIELTDAYWASASGYRIGAMYDALWSAIERAPVPPPRSPKTAPELRIYREAYRDRLAELARPLVRHAIRYWELTLAMLERTGVPSDWAPRIQADLERARSRLGPRASLDPALGPIAGATSSPD